MLFSAELYISPADGTAYTLHVSAKLGQHRLEGKTWAAFTTDWAWWETNGWWATPLKMSARDVFLPHEAIEFQISRRQFAGDRLRVMLSVPAGSNPFPQGADPLRSDAWLELDLRN